MVPSALVASFVLAIMLAVGGGTPAGFERGGAHSAASGAVGASSASLRRAVTTRGINEHLRAFNRIAAANARTRASGTPGYQASVDYVAGKLEAAGYDVTVQPLEAPIWRESGEPVLDPITPGLPAYRAGADFLAMKYSGSGALTERVIPTRDLVVRARGDARSTSGCQRSDFPASTSGNIALIQRGTCPFEDKARNAQAAGAAGVIIFNDGGPERTGVIRASLGRPFRIPVVFSSFAVGRQLFTLSKSGAVTVRLSTSTLLQTRPGINVLADTPGGRRDRTVIAGAHLDSVPEGPGINDNASGSATLLEIAEEMSELRIRPRNKVRFAFWGAEEYGLIGSTYYVGRLDRTALDNIAAYLNFDMVGSPNYVRFVYDGDGSPTGVRGPPGSGKIEDVFVSYFRSRRLASSPTTLDKGSDHVPFMDAGIPVGGLFTGAGDIKTARQQRIYGGSAGQAYDPCYHQACDDIRNISRRAIDQMSDGAAHAILRFATRTL